MRDLFTRYGGPLTAGFMALTAFWLLALVVLPYLYLFENSFRPYLPVVEMGGPKDFYSLNNYLTFFQSPIHIHVFFSTILYSSLVTVLCFFIAYPLAYYLSKVAKPIGGADAVPAASHPALGQRDPALLRLVHHPGAQGAAQFRPHRARHHRDADPLALGFSQHHHRPRLHLCPVHAVPALQRGPVARHQSDRGGRRIWARPGGASIGA